MRLSKEWSRFTPRVLFEGWLEVSERCGLFRLKPVRPVKNTYKHQKQRHREPGWTCVLTRFFHNVSYVFGKKMHLVVRKWLRSSDDKRIGG